MKHFDFHMQSTEDLSTPPSPRGRNPHISLTAPQRPSSPSPAARPNLLDSHSRSAGAANSSRSRQSSRVRFIGDEEASEQDNSPSPPNGINVEWSLPRAPPIAYSHQRTESDDSFGYFDLQRSSGRSTPLGGNEYISSKANLISKDGNAREEEEEGDEKGWALHGAHERAQRLASAIRPPSVRSKGQSGLFQTLSRRVRNRPFSLPQQSKSPSWNDLDKMEKQSYGSDNDDDGDVDDGHTNAEFQAHADQLRRGLAGLSSYPLTRTTAHDGDIPSGAVTPLEEREYQEDYVKRPSHYRPGVLGMLLGMYGSRMSNGPQTHDTELPSPAPLWGSWSRPSKRRWCSFKSANLSMPSFDSISPFGGPRRSSVVKKRRIRGNSGFLLKNKFKRKEDMHFTAHILETRQRKKYLDRLCRALMNSGAPLHRLEEYMRTTARALKLEGSFTYFPGTMFMAFEDSATDTTDLKFVQSHEAVDLGRLRDIQEIYKDVVHSRIDVEEAIRKLRSVMNAKRRFGIFWLIFLKGLASAMAGPFAFGARPIDMPICFILGCVLAVLQHVLIPRSSNYANIFEVSAAVITSFFARAFGSIRTSNGEPLFCFSALAQSSICLILPGYIVLCGALALQSRNIIAGSVRLVYAIIYSLFLGFGIVIGTAVYGLLDSNASVAFACPPSPIQNEYLQRFPFVVAFAVCSSLINQAKPKQIPVMVFIATAGYVVLFFAGRRFTSTQISSALGALAIGMIGNLYSRLGQGLAAAAILPAIFIQLPSGLASSGSLVSSLIIATQIRKHGSSSRPLGELAADLLANSTGESVEDVKYVMEELVMSRFLGNVAFDIGYGMLEVAIGISGGLFMAALVVYPFGKKRSGLFSF
ncbi:DUF1212 domain-containing protein [Histoplasma capsulatum G186AR]|uniref:DUF1212 domain-containing protein n=2 Tax=Ajellomyces capsulatus TaxID=5037 RepID=C0NPR8_AJECG|nr:DUF1212 domain-containing protein [Histoplasma capsulatum G186AR]EEH06928.1 DUF1212 domain-containing protein [Histoplasma capsulatum G186AR]KAG5294045.1 DUF1212 domain-containing protein [Histoplasma capsulatum]QSS75497.1 DUF1212 domain-containing protein [Histoplasma capsulatum G186AR]